MPPRSSAPFSPRRTVAVLLLTLSLAAPPAAVAETIAVSASVDLPVMDHADLAAAYGQLALSFEANQGQADASVDFVAPGQGYALALTEGDAILALHAPATGSPDADQPAPE